jgi:hypothetical protein
MQLNGNHAHQDHLGRPRLRWRGQVEEGLKKMKVRNWREKCKDRRLWNEIVKQAKTHQGL